MRHAAAAIALLLCCGCGTPSSDSRSGTRAADSVAAAAKPVHPLIDRVWARSDSIGAAGTIRVFLGDGTLVMDSCVEPYRLATWQWESDSVVVWQEDTAEIRAVIVEVGAEDLVLSLELEGGAEIEHYRTAAVPFVCPDMER